MVLCFNQDEDKLIEIDHPPPVAFIQALLFLLILWTIIFRDKCNKPEVHWALLAHVVTILHAMVARQDIDQLILLCTTPRAICEKFPGAVKETV